MNSVSIINLPQLTKIFEDTKDLDEENKKFVIWPIREYMLHNPTEWQNLSENQKVLFDSLISGLHSQPKSLYETVKEEMRNALKNSTPLPPLNTQENKQMQIDILFI